MPYGMDGMCLNSGPTTVPGPTSPGKTDPDGFARLCASGICFENGEPITVWRNSVYAPGFDATYRYSLLPMHVPIQAGVKAVEVIGGSTANGTPVLQMAGDGSIDAQQFAIVRTIVANIFYWKIAMKVDTNKCIGPVGNGTGILTPMEVQDCNGGANQAWTISAGANSGGFTFVNLASGRCLAVSSAALTEGAQVDLMDCNANATNQTFKVAASL